MESTSRTTLLLPLIGLCKVLFPGLPMHTERRSQGKDQSKYPRSAVTPMHIDAVLVTTHIERFTLSIEEHVYISKHELDNSDENDGMVTYKAQSPSMILWHHPRHS